jgi:small-conductance mechanosensitive channel
MGAEALRSDMTALMDLYTIAGIAAVGIAVLAAEEVISFLIRRVLKRAQASPTVVRDIRTSLRLIAVALILWTIASVVDLSSLFTTLTVSGILAVTVSLALQNTLSNMIAGLLLFSEGLLRLGDTIQYGGMKGDVVRVGMRNTWIKTEAGEIAVISNSSLSSGPLVNHTVTDRLSKKYAFSTG